MITTLIPLHPTRHPSVKEKRSNQTPPVMAGLSSTSKPRAAAEGTLSRLSAHHWQSRLIQTTRFGNTTLVQPSDPLAVEFTNVNGQPYSLSDILHELVPLKDQLDNQPGTRISSDQPYQSGYLTVLDQKLGFRMLPLVTVKNHLVTQGYLASSETAPGAFVLTEKALQAYAIANRVDNAQVPADYSVSDPRINDNKLSAYVTDLTADAYAGKFQPMYGRQVEINRLVKGLIRRLPKNLLLVGEAGVGKTTIVTGLAGMIARGDIPALKNMRVWKIDPHGLIAGDGYRGEVEKKINALTEVLEANEDVIAFFDKAEWMTAPQQAVNGGQGVSSLFAAFFEKYSSRVLLSTTEDQYRKRVQKDEVIPSLFHVVSIPPTSQEETLEIMRRERPEFEKTHGATYPDEILKKIVELSANYVHDKPFPKKAIEIMDDAGVLANLQGTEAVDISHVGQVISERTKVPMNILTEDETKKLLRLEETLHKRVIGQETAVNSVSQAIRRRRSGLRQTYKGPMGSFVFLGPTGTGKTELAKALSEWLSGDEKNLIRLDMSEYRERHNVARLIGSPPGYVGYGEGGQLTEAVRKRPYSVILFDEIEKAHPDIYPILLSIMDEGRLTDGEGRTIDFRNTLIIMTSNAGAQAVSNIKRQAEAALAAGAVPEDQEDAFQKEVADQINTTKHNAVHTLFTPEFRNRVDDIIEFDELTREQKIEIIKLNVQSLKNDVLHTKQATLKFSEDAYQFLSDQLFERISEMHDREGGRKVLAVIKKHVEDPLSNLVIESPPKPGSVIEITADPENKNQLKFEVVEPPSLANPGANPLQQ